MKKIICASVILAATLSFAKDVKENKERKPANSSTMQCTGFSYAFGAGVGAKVEFAIGYSGDLPQDTFKIGGKEGLSGNDLSVIDEAILSGKEFKADSKKIKIVLDKKSKVSWSSNRGDAEMNYFTLWVDGKVDGGGICDRYNH